MQLNATFCETFPFANDSHCFKSNGGVKKGHAINTTFCETFCLKNVSHCFKSNGDKKAHAITHRFL